MGNTHPGNSDQSCFKIVRFVMLTAAAIASIVVCS
jgi:hypothetical protein